MTHTELSLARGVLGAARVLTASAALLGALGLVGRLSSWHELATWVPAWTVMARHPAWGLLLATGGLALHLWPGARDVPRRRCAAWLGLAATALGLWGIHGWSAPGGPGVAWLADWTPTGVRPAWPLGPLACALGGLAVWTLECRPRAGMFASDLLALALGAIGASTFVGYAADLEVAPRLVEGLGLAPSAGLAWTLGAAAVLLAHPGRGLGAILVALGPGGGVARRLLPVVAAVPIAMAASRLMLDWAGLGRTAFGTAAEMVTLLGLGFLMVLWASYPLQWSEQALHDSEARLRGLVEAMPDALFFLDVSDRITEANPAAARLFGQPRKAFVGQPLTRWIQPEPVDRTPGLFDALAEAECPYVPGLALRLGEPPSPVEVTRTHLSTVTGEPDALICRDVSERERTAEALASRTSELMQARALERLKDHVYSSLSHELKTPLTVIRGNTEMLQEDWPDDVRIQSLQDAVQRLNDHIEALLDHAALLAGDMPLYMGPVAAQEVLTALAERYRTSAAAHGLTLHVACEAGLPPVTADGHRLSQALAALLDNAVKFASAGGHIGARARQDGNDVVLEVWNSGPGIPAAVLARLGETFYQAEIGNTRRHGGLGLGLAIARMLVALHGGTLTGSSCAGKGTTFAIRLPTEELAAASATPTTQRP